MSYASLRDFLDKLDATGDLVRVKEPVSTVLEMTEIQTRLLAEQGPAVLFEKPVMASGETSPMPVLVNLFGTVERVARGVTTNFAGGGAVERTRARQLREVGEALAFLRQPEPPGGFREAVSMLPLLRTVMAMKPKTVSSAPCQEVVLKGSDLSLIPIPEPTRPY